MFARDDSGWRQYDPQSLALRPEPAEADIVRLLQDATSVNKARYGQEVRASSDGYVTDTGVLLREALIKARAERVRDIQISGDFRLSESLLPKNRARISEVAQSIPENTLALSPGIKLTEGIRNAR